MNLFVLDAVFRILGIRGPISRDDEFRRGPDRSSLTANASRLTRILVVFVVIVALLSLALWAAVWLAIQSL
jgi:hypothetical protein